MVCADRPFSRAYKNYVLVVLTAVYTLSTCDLNLMGLLLEPIKQDLHLSDAQLGFLTGIAFGLFYATLGLPFARWADRGNRATITSISIALWGATVMLCLAVRSFSQLVLARMAAAIGESGCMPPTYSLVGDYFPQPAERARAMTIYMTASPLPSLLSFLVGGWLNARYGWRLTFFFMGIPGLLIALLVKLTVREPRQKAVVRKSLSAPSPGILEVLQGLWAQPTTRHLSLAVIVLLTFGWGLFPWYAAFMIRSHGMTIQELGIWLGLVFGLGGVAGTLLGGFIADKCFPGDERSQMRLTAWLTASLVLWFALFLLLPQKRYALTALVPLIVIFNFSFGPTFALMQRLVTDNVRATAIALLMLLANLIGMGVGPQLVGWLSDLLHPRFGADSLRYAMLIVSVLSLWTAFHFGRAARTVTSDLQSMDAQKATAAPVVELARP